MGIWGTRFPDDESQPPLTNGRGRDGVNFPHGGGASVANPNYKYISVSTDIDQQQQVSPSRVFATKQFTNCSYEPWTTNTKWWLGITNGTSEYPLHRTKVPWVSETNHNDSKPSNGSDRWRQRMEKGLPAIVQWDKTLMISLTTDKNCSSE